MPISWKRGFPPRPPSPLFFIWKFIYAAWAVTRREFNAVVFCAKKVTMSVWHYMSKWQDIVIIKGQPFSLQGDKWIMTYIRFHEFHNMLCLNIATPLLLLKVKYKVFCFRKVTLYILWHILNFTNFIICYVSI